MNNTPRVTITRVGKRWPYFQVFILGLYELEKAGKIRLRFRCEYLFRLSTIFPENKIIGRIFSKLNNCLTKDSYNLYGKVECKGETKRFCIDSADAPYIFDSQSLNDVDVYFKMQCPKEIEPDKGFPLSRNIRIPYIDMDHIDKNIKQLTGRGPRKPLTNLKENLHKIKPLLNGFRILSSLNSYSALKCGFDNYRKGCHNEPSKILMCYFGNAKGPKPEVHVVQPDWDWEADIIGFYGEQVSHPNEKRAKVARLLQSLGDYYDGRVISEDFADGKSLVHNELVIPIQDFCAFISDFAYNMNISGYRMSIPSRFIESFIVGTAIVTDKLAVKWFLPFDEEVVETVEMGYLPDNEVDWSRVKHDIKALPKVDKSRILQLFNQKWSPENIAEYIVKTIINN